MISETGEERRSGAGRKTWSGLSPWRLPAIDYGHINVHQHSLRKNATGSIRDSGIVVAGDLAPEMRQKAGQGAGGQWPDAAEYVPAV
jgi:hypothetical protein